MNRIDKPWGYYEDHVEGPGYKIKKLVIFPGQRLSLQKHEFRDESWTVVEGNGTYDWAANDEDEIETLALFEDSVVKIQKGATHRISNKNGKGNLVIIEVQHGEKCMEEDIIRYEDDYKRM